VTLCCQHPLPLCLTCDLQKHTPDTIQTTRPIPHPHHMCCSPSCSQWTRPTHLYTVHASFTAPCCRAGMVQVPVPAAALAYSSDVMRWCRWGGKAMAPSLRTTTLLCHCWLQGLAQCAAQFSLRALCGLNFQTKGAAAAGGITGLVVGRCQCVVYVY
jgi:hypothetical protein